MSKSLLCTYKSGEIHRITIWSEGLHGLGSDVWENDYA